MKAWSRFKSFLNRRKSATLRTQMNSTFNHNHHGAFNHSNVMSLAPAIITTTTTKRKNNEFDSTFKSSSLSQIKKMGASMSDLRDALRKKNKKES